MATNPKEKEDSYGYLPGESVGGRLARRAQDAIGFVSQAMRAGDEATARGSIGAPTGAVSLSDPLIPQVAQPAPAAPQQTAPKPVVPGPPAAAPVQTPAQAKAAPATAAPTAEAPADQTVSTPDGFPKAPVDPTSPTSADRVAMDARAHGDAMQSIKLQQQIMDGGAPAEGFRPAQIRHSGNDWQSRNDLRNLEVSASSITSGPNSPDAQAYQTALKTDAALKSGSDPALIANNHDGAFMDRTKAAERSAGERAALQEQGTNARFGMSNKIAQQKADAEQVKLGFDTKSAAQIQSLQQQIIAEKDPAKLAVLQDKMQAITGKYQRPDAANKFTVVPGGQAIDARTGQAYTVPARVIDNQTMKFIDQPGVGGVADPPKNHIDALKKDKSLAKQFDETYGAGASAKILGGK